MSRKKTMPEDVKAACIAMVKGYVRRTETYMEERSALMRTADKSLTNGQAGDLARKLRALEDVPETRRMRAVENALESIGSDLPRDQQERLREAIYTSCVAGREHPFERLGVDGMERTCFYQRRNRFLEEIAIRLEML